MLANAGLARAALSMESASVAGIDPAKRIKELENALLAARGGVEDTLKTLQCRLEETRAEKAMFEKTSAQRQKERNDARKERDALKAQVDELEKKVTALSTKPTAKAPPPRPAPRPAPAPAPARAPAPAPAPAVNTEELDRLRAKIAELERALELSTARAAEPAPAPAARPAGAADEEIERLQAKIAQLERSTELTSARGGEAAPAELDAALATEREQNAPLREEAARWKERVRALEHEVASMRPKQAATPPNKGRDIAADVEEKLLARIAELERGLELSGTTAATDGTPDERVKDLEAQLAAAREANAPALEELAKAKDRIRALEREVAAMRPAASSMTVPLPST